MRLYKARAQAFATACATKKKPNLCVLVLPAMMALETLQSHNNNRKKHAAALLGRCCTFSSSGAYLERVT